jgi:hypothetical protein
VAAAAESNPTDPADRAIPDRIGPACGVDVIDIESQETSEKSVKETKP